MTRNWRKDQVKRMSGVTRDIGWHFFPEFFSTRETNPSSQKAQLAQPHTTQKLPSPILARANQIAMLPLNLTTLFGKTNMLYCDTQSDKVTMPKPSMAFLIILNGLLCFASLAIGNHLFGVIFAIPSTLLFMALSAIPQAILGKTVERKRILRPLPRIIVYTSPWWISALLPLLGVHANREPNKQNPAISPSGEYIAKVSSPAEGWVIRMESRSSSSKWTEKTDFVPHLNIYWRWDSDDRFWIYNSDNGVVYFMLKQPDSNEWTMKEWGYSRTRKEDISQTVMPPDELYPHYAK